MNRAKHFEKCPSEFMKISKEEKISEWEFFSEMTFWNRSQVPGANACMFISRVYFSLRKKDDGREGNALLSTRGDGTSWHSSTGRKPCFHLLDRYNNKNGKCLTPSCWQNRSTVECQSFHKVPCK